MVIFVFIVVEFLWKDRNTERQRNRKTEKQKDRETERQRNRKTKRQTFAVIPIKNAFRK
jgi:hypothetical protein